jgi:hypothetical protein
MLAEAPGDDSAATERRESAEPTEGEAEREAPNRQRERSVESTE